MKIGAVFPHLEIGSDPSVIRDWAQAAEEIGYSHLLVYDHVIGAEHRGREPKLWGPYTEESSFHELFVLFGFFAACTERVGLASGVVTSSFPPGNGLAAGSVQAMVADMS